MVLGCIHCPGLNFTSKKELLTHKADAHFLVISCKKCNIEFPDRTQARNHVWRDHLNEQEEEMIEDESDAKRPRLEEPDDNSEQIVLPEGIVTNDRMHQCSMCFHEFHFPLLLKQHMMVVHFKKDPLVCHVCQAPSAQIDNVSCHIIRLHMPELTALIVKQNKCRYCNKYFSRKSDNVKHSIRKHMHNLKRLSDKKLQPCEKKAEGEKEIKLEVENEFNEDFIDVKNDPFVDIAEISENAQQNCDTK